jgi:prepilin-type N-terminal cleavage/methylation domain-containing protein
MKNNSQKAFSLIELSIVILIIGILIAGITQSSILIKKYKLNSAQTITQSSPVTSIKDLALWLEPVMESSITSATNDLSPIDGDAVALWNDTNSQSITKVNVAQSTSSARPTYKTNGIGNLPTLSFDGGDYLETALTTIPAGYNTYTIFLVWQQNTSGTTQVIFHQRGSGCSADYAGTYLSTGGYINGWACGSGDTQASTYSASKPYATIYRVDNTQTNNVTVYANGTKTGPTQKTVNVGATATAVGYGGGSTYYFRGYISEVIVFTRALKDAEISDVRGYLAKKYGFGA